MWMTLLWYGNMALLPGQVPPTPECTASLHTVHRGRRVRGKNSLSGCNGSTHTDRYLHFTSHHHGRQLLSSIRSLQDRAQNICTQTKRWEELTHLTDVFHSNGYPRPLVKCVLSKTPPARSADGDNDSMEGIKFLCLPYVKGISEKIEQGCQKLSIRAVFKSNNKLR